MPHNKARVLVADDHPEFAERVAQLLTADFEVIGTASDGLSLLELADKMKPAIVITDIMMPHVDGIEATRQLRTRESAPEVIILTGHTDQDFIDASFAAGALGYVSKSRIAELPKAIKAVLEGRRFVSASE